MEIKKGIGVSPGVVIGTAVVLDAEDLVVPRRQVEASETGAEAERLGRAIAESMVDLTELRNAVTDKHGKVPGLRLPLTAFHSKRDLIRQLPSADLQWTGSDNNVQGLLRVLARRDVPRPVESGVQGARR